MPVWSADLKFGLLSGFERWFFETTTLFFGRNPYYIKPMPN